MTTAGFILGEFRRSIDERHRLTLPPELAETLLAPEPDCILAKERPGSLSLWNAARWRNQLSAGMRLVESKMHSGRLDGRLDEVQRFGRLLSTRQADVQLDPRGRLLIPEGFREFLGIDAGSDAMVIGAGLCVEIWRPDAWLKYLEENMPEFRQLFDNLSA